MNIKGMALATGAAVALCTTAANAALQITYDFSGTCTKCGIAGSNTTTAQLILNNYTPGQPVVPLSIVSFSLNGSNLLDQAGVLQALTRQKEIDIIQRRLDVMTLALEKTQTQLEDLIQKRTDYRQQKSDLTQRISDLQDEIAPLIDRKTALQQAVAGIETQIAAYQLMGPQFAAVIAILQGQIAVLNEDITSIDRTLKPKTVELAKSEGGIKILDAQIDRTTDNIADTIGDLAGAKKILVEQKKELDLAMAAPGWFNLQVNFLSPSPTAVDFYFENANVTFATSDDGSFDLSTKAAIRSGTGLWTQAGYVAPLDVPEPMTWATMTIGFGLIGMAARRRRKTVLA